MNCKTHLNDLLILNPTLLDDDMSLPLHQTSTPTKGLNPPLISMSGAAIDKVAVMRFILALSALLVISFESSLSGYSAHAIKKLLFCYTGYSLLLCFLTLRPNRLCRWIEHWSPWADICWFTLLFVYGIETSSIFYFGFFFAILAASFRGGFASGLGVTISSSILILIVGYLVIPTGHEFAWSRFLLRPIFLLVVGYLVAYWGGSELKLKRQLLLLKEIGSLSNPRFGVDRTVGYVMERLREFFGADACLIVMFDSHASNYTLCHTNNNNPEKPIRPDCVPDDLARQLLDLPQMSAIIFRTVSPFLRWLGRVSCYEYDLVEGNRRPIRCEKVSPIAASLDTLAFISVPIRQNYQIVGRIYLTSNQWLSAFNNSDTEFLNQAVEHVMPIIENIRLVDRLALDAAECERQRIARDIHDTVVQPYIGLQMGLSAVRQKMQGGTNVEGDIERLFELTDHGISDLRNYIYGLKSNNNKATSLEPAVRRFAAKFSEATGISVQVEFDKDNHFYINDRLTAEVFQMIAEGLSNIRRHTRSGQARVAVNCRNDSLYLQMENEGRPESSTSFVPRSLSERSAALGGKIEVSHLPSDITRVEITIPL